MPNDPASIKVTLDKSIYAINTSITGAVEITTQADIDFESFKIELLYALRGKLSGETKVLTSIILQTGGRWMRNNTYSLNFNLGEVPCSTYNGKNATLNWMARTQIQLPRWEKKKISSKYGNGILSRLFTNPEKKFEIEKPILIQREIDYQIPEKILEVKRNSSNFALFVLVLVGFCWVAIFAGFRTPGPIFLGLHLLLIPVFRWVLSARALQNIGLVVHGDNQTLKGKIKPNRVNLQSYQMEFRYSIVESVKDDRGSSTKIHKKDLYVSEFVWVSPHGLDFSVPLPIDPAPCPINFGPLNVYWEAELTFWQGVFPRIQFKGKI